jgi:hypothetical protein
MTIAVKVSIGIEGEPSGQSLSATTLAARPS